MTEAHTPYKKLSQLAQKARLFESISALLHWDQETYMPKQGIALRSLQLELLAGLEHQAKIDPAFVSELKKIIDLESGEIKDPSLSFEEGRTVRSFRRDYLLQANLPNHFVQAFAKLNAEAITVWTEARAKSDFSLFAPHLEKTLTMLRQKAHFLNPHAPIYDVLIDSHEADMTASELEGYFTELKKGLKELLQKIQKRPQVNDRFLEGDFDREKQLAFGNALAEQIGYDPEKGRLDLSTHPFSTSLHPYDSRITTRISKGGFFDCLSTILHEVGHSLYEMGLPVDFFGTPRCQATSLGIHESQSRFYETYVGQSKSFWFSLLPRLQKIFPDALASISLEEFYPAINRVSPSLIRVESDEVTYTFHVILRFELEKALLEGTLTVQELPEAWNAKMKEYLGLSVPSDSLGCLQDIHWSMGEFGYFPTYSLGNLYGAQFFNAFAAEHPDWESRFRTGEFLFVKEWLGKHIHRHGRVYSAKELVQNVSGKSLSTEPYLRYLNEKYGSIYSL